MATLLFENGPDRGSGVELVPGRTYSIGRDPRCDVVVRDDLVSRLHCRIKEFKGAWYVKDADSTNGVLLNDGKVGQAEIHYGDRIQVGGAILSFLEESLDQVKKETTLGGYQLRERIGRGGMGTVYRALQASLGREVALKLLSPHLVKDQKFIDQFLREARAAGQLNHPNIVQVYDVGQERDQYYYSMEYVEGGSLEDRLRETQTLSPEDALPFMLQAARALEYAESRHIVHRDIKPDNLMVTPEGVLKIADLGLAFSLKDSSQRPGEPILGTPHYISPEQALRREVDIRSDIYSLGATFYRMLSGQTLFQGESAEEIIRKAVREDPRPLREVNPQVPEKIASIVHRMLEKDPEDRYATAAELREDLERLAHHRGRTVVLWSAVAVAVAAVGVAVVLALRGPEKEIVTAIDSESQEEKFRALSDLQRKEVELEAVREFANVLLATEADASARHAALQEWVSDFGYLPVPLPEKEQARAAIARIEAERAQREAFLAREAVRREELLDGFGKAFDAALAQEDPLAAFLLARDIDPDAEEDAEFQAQLAELRRTLEQRAMDAEHERFSGWSGRVEAASAEDRTREAAELCEEALAHFPPPPPGLASDFALMLEEERGWFESRRDLLVQRADALKDERLRADLRLVVDALGRDFQAAVLGLDLARAAALLDAAQEQVLTREYREILPPLASRLTFGAEILERFFAALDAGELPADQEVVVSSGESGTLLDRDPATRMLRLRFSRGVGSSTRQEPYASFASAAGLQQLLWHRLDLAPAEQRRLLEVMLVVEVTRWAHAVHELGPLLQRYHEEEGWEPLRASLPAVELQDPAATAGSFERLLQQAALELGDAAGEVQNEYRRELLCRRDLLQALSPFLDVQSAVGWSRAALELRLLLEQRRDTLLLKMVYPLLHDGDDYSLATSSS